MRATVPTQPRPWFTVGILNVVGDVNIGHAPKRWTTSEAIPVSISGSNLGVWDSLEIDHS